MTTRNEILVGKIVHWSNLPESDHLPTGRGAGHGEVLATLDDGLLLVRTVQEANDWEPPHMVVLAVADQTLMYFDDLGSFRQWYEALMEIDEDAPRGPTHSASRARH
jgi:hypothetical protein